MSGDVNQIVNCKNNYQPAYVTLRSEINSSSLTTDFSRNDTEIGFLNLT